MDVKLYIVSISSFSEYHSKCGPLSITRSDILSRQNNMYDLVKQAAKEIYLPEVDCNSPSNMGRSSLSLSLT